MHFLHEKCLKLEENDENRERSRGQEYLMDIAKIAETVSAEIIYCADNSRDLDITGAVAADLMSEVMLDTEEGSLIITGLINPQVIRTAEMLDIYAVMRTEATMFEACGRLYTAGIVSGQPA